MPLFAFANAGVSLSGLIILIINMLPVPLRYTCGDCLLANNLGVMLFSYISVKLKITQMPDNSI